MTTFSTLTQTQFDLPGLQSVYWGKVRDVYFFDKKIASIATDRISAFDHILPEAIPYKGQVLNQLSAYFLEACRDLVPIWLEGVPDPNVSVGKRCEPIKIEMVIRGYLVGHAWREYRGGNRFLCGVEMPGGMRESEPFPKPIITPATKEEEGHDEDISREQIIGRGIVSAVIYEKLESYTRCLFERGQKMAAERGMILVDTKYEFGIDDHGEITLIDEIHTPDSSRYFYGRDYEYNLSKNLPQNHLSKEFVREWLMANDFQGLEGQTMPQMSPEVIRQISRRYTELYEQLTGKAFIPADSSEDIQERVYRNLVKWCDSEG